MIKNKRVLSQMKDVVLYDSGEEGLEISSKQREFSSQLELNALRFSFQDGRVDQLCPSTEELPWSLNLKRGVLSALQNSMRDLNNDARLYEVRRKQRFYIRVTTLKIWVERVYYSVTLGNTIIL